VRKQYTYIALDKKNCRIVGCESLIYPVLFFFAIIIFPVGLIFNLGCAITISKSQLNEAKPTTTERGLMTLLCSQVLVVCC
jgi:hypothetical protein